jgi:hypothetical protein
MLDIERFIGYLVSAGIGGIGGACAYFMKIKGIEDSLKTKCDVKQVKEIVEETLKPHLALQERESKWNRAVMASIAKQVGAEIPQIQ